MMPMGALGALVGALGRSWVLKNGAKWLPLGSSFATRLFMSGTVIKHIEKTKKEGSLWQWTYRTHLSWAMEEPRVVPAAGKTIALLAPPTQPSHAINKVIRKQSFLKLLRCPKVG